MEPDENMSSCTPRLRQMPIVRVKAFDANGKTNNGGNGSIIDCLRRIEQRVVLRMVPMTDCPKRIEQMVVML